MQRHQIELGLAWTNLVLTLRRLPRLARDQQCERKSRADAEVGGGGKNGRGQGAGVGGVRTKQQEKGGGGGEGRAEKAGKIKGGLAGRWEMNARMLEVPSTRGGLLLRVGERHAYQI